MKVTDIQIKDWLRLRYKHYYTGEEIVKDFQVSQIVDANSTISNFEPDYYIWSAEGGNMGNLSSLEPIPLTNGILKANGLVKLHDKGENSEWHYSYILWFYIRVIHSNYFYVHVEKDDRLKLRIHTVNELQHALRIFGLDDLANNFKI